MQRTEAAAGKEGVMKTIAITTGIRDALDALGHAEAIYVPGRDSASIVELPKLALADAVVDAARQSRLDRLPQRARLAPIVEIQMRAKRKRRA